MIDSTKSPLPTWRRYATPILLTVLIIAAGYLLWAKELHHSASGLSSTPVPAATAVHRSTTTTVSPSTTIPGGIPVSPRDPFGS